MFVFLFQDVPLPVALFSLNGANGTVDMSPNGATKAVSNNIKFAPGPFGNPNGSFYFSGINSSYVKLRKSGQLDTRFSIAVFAWVHLDNSSGPIYKHELSNKYYGLLLRVFHSTLGVKVRYIDRKTSFSYLLFKKNVLEAYSWNFIGTTYDYHTGVATIFVNNNTVMLKYIKAKMELATDSSVRIGAMKKQKLYFRGRISCLQVYDQALSVDQIIKVKARCNQTGKYVELREFTAKFFIIVGKGKQHNALSVRTRYRLTNRNRVCKVVQVNCQYRQLMACLLRSRVYFTAPSVTKRPSSQTSTYMAI